MYRLLAGREQKKSYSVQQYGASEWTPVVGEEDFRDISVFPTTEEIFSVARGEISQKVRPNIIEGKYKNVMHYLDTHFRLLRYIIAISEIDLPIAKTVFNLFEKVYAHFSRQKTSLVHVISEFIEMYI